MNPFDDELTIFDWDDEEYEDYQDDYNYDDLSSGLPLESSYEF